MLKQSNWACTILAERHIMHQKSQALTCAFPVSDTAPDNFWLNT